VEGHEKGVPGRRQVSIALGKEGGGVKVTEESRKERGGSFEKKPCFGGWRLLVREKRHNTNLTVTKRRLELIAVPTMKTGKKVWGRRKNRLLAKRQTTRTIFCRDSIS